MTIVDAHHHIWRVADTPWLQGPAIPRIFGDYGPIRRDYLIEEYLADAMPQGVVQSVYSQVNVAQGDELEEVRRVSAISAAHGLPGAVTAYANLAVPGLDSLLDRQCAAGPVRAIRQQMHWHENPQYRFASRPDLMDDPVWRRGLAALGARGLMFELQVFPGQMPAAARLVAAHPGITFILLHAGMLEDRSAQGWAAWRQGMAAIAAHPNVYTKLSGLGTFLRACSEPAWRPVIEQTVDLFGPARCLFGSNFPIEKLWTTFATLVAVTRACLSRYRADEQAAILHGTATRLYGLPA